MSFDHKITQSTDTYIQQHTYNIHTTPYIQHHIITYNNIDGLQKYYAELEKSDKKRWHTLYFHLHETLDKTQQCDRSGLMCHWAWGYRRGMWAKGNEEIFLVWWNVLYLDKVDVHMSICIFINCWTAHLKSVHIIDYKLNLSKKKSKHSSGIEYISHKRALCNQEYKQSQLHVTIGISPIHKILRDKSQTLKSVCSMISMI